MNPGNRTFAGALAAGLVLVLLAGCNQQPPEAPAAAGEGRAAGEGLDRKQVAESIQAQMLPAIERTFARRNAKTRLEGDVVYVRMDGDAEADMARGSDCRILTGLVRATQSVILELPNGTIECVALLESQS